jgi:glycosyltransferase involved in cell wall biosynthesis
MTAQKTTKLFEFLKYVQPMWYYRLHERSAFRLFSEAGLEALRSGGSISAFNGYREPGSVRMDMLYQALQSGFIPDAPTPPTGDAARTVTSVHDNYLFLARHFPAKWSWYVLTVRLLSLKNPFAEIASFAGSRGIRRMKKGEADLYPGYLSHEPSESLREALVSVVIPTLDRYEYLTDVLDDLEKQDHLNIEVVVCDQSDPYRDDLYANRRFPVKVIRQSEKALWKARNSCYEASSGDFILLFDDDSRVAPDWVSQHLRCLSFFNVKISAGVTETVIGHGLSSKEGRFHLSDVFDTGNAMVAREVFERVGLFDRQFEKQRMGDGEFGLRAYLGGYAVISNPYARRLHLKADAGGLRHFGGWDAFRPGRLFAPRPIPSVLYFCRRYFGRDSAILLLLLSLPSSVIPYRYKGSGKAKWLTPLLMPFVGPLLAVQAAVSWRSSGRMLKQGPRIEFPLRRNSETVTASALK